MIVRLVGLVCSAGALDLLRPLPRDGAAFGEATGVRDALAAYLLELGNDG